MKYIIGLDLGTTAIKAVLYGENGNVIHVLSKEAELLHTPEHFIEQNPGDWYETPLLPYPRSCGRHPYKRYLRNRNFVTGNFFCTG